MKSYFVKKKPDTGGVTSPPNPLPMKNIDESLPVIFFFLATQEKQDPNCHEMKNPSAAVPRYKQMTLELAVEHRNMAVARQTASEHRIMFLSWG